MIGKLIKRITFIKAGGGRRKGRLVRVLRRRMAGRRRGNPKLRLARMVIRRIRRR